MFYNNKMNKKKITYKTYDYASFAKGLNVNIDENITPINQSKNTYNFCYKNGALTTGLGVTKVKIPYNLSDPTLLKDLDLPPNNEVLAVFNYKYYFKELTDVDRVILIYCSDGFLYYNSMLTSGSYMPRLSSNNLLHCVTLSNVVNYRINNEQVLLLIRTNELRVFRTSSNVVDLITNAPNIKSMCIHNDRLFVTTYDVKNTVWYSDDLDPTNWNIGDNQAGCIEFNDARGNCIKVISFDDHVYVFREYGISKITAYTNQQEFGVQHLYISGGRIYADTICVCGDRIIFLATDGLYSFNGITTKKINLNMESIISDGNNDAKAAFHNGAYHLACKIDFPDDSVIGCENTAYVNNALLKIDIDSGDVSIMRGVDIRYIDAINDVGINLLLCCVMKSGKSTLGMITNSGEFFDTNLYKTWQSPLSDFDQPNCKKVVKKFHINCNCDTTIKFIYDDKSKTFNLSGSNKRQAITPNISGYKIGVEISTNSKVCDISNPQITVGYL